MYFSCKCIDFIDIILIESTFLHRADFAAVPNAVSILITRTVLCTVCSPKTAPTVFSFDCHHQIVSFSHKAKLR